MSLVCNIEDQKGFVKQKAEALSLNIQQLKPMIKFLIMQGVDLPKLLEGTGIEQHHLIHRDISIDAFQHQRLLLNAIKHAPDMSFGAQLGVQDFINNDSLLASRVMSCDTAGEAMHLLSDYYKLWTNQFSLNFEANERWGEFSITPHIDFGATLPFYIEYLYAILYSFGCYCLGEKSVPLIFEFSYPEPSKSAYYGKYFSETVRFNQEKNRVLLPKPLLERKLVFSNPILAEENDKTVKTQMEHIAPSDTVSRTRALIQKNALSMVSLEHISAQLCMSSRSLRRHLQAQGFSFQTIVDQERHDIAKKLLSSNKQTIQEIAILLGYNDASSFSRAFKRWESASPKEYQLQQHQKS
ncbi:hypothetical protein A3715_04165 [Oleiphilus sp. HI0009]|nr:MULTISPECIES: AraC family transcriptional regulator [unclassified Oleiphilus]KZX84528.1 hypothetical protein A3715_04165 [Oleiphilus sp. HI0009]MCH2158990.1 AraC family transcriptional regulator [Oleiphilaceae bacterium]KZY63514.1 hypothetical protein A3738_11680 [Oleiphilus sp. HI0066]KZY69106.1 hypothetical protein A3739_09685 [Oleiphilus sp. HI0067]KZZ59873.1 hypothetical protein A3762_04075 [Oleiphilus sp. HI0125]